MVNKINNEVKAQKNLQLHNNYIQIRLPDFLVQLQNYDGHPKTLCEIVSGKTTTNSTKNEY